MATLFGSIMYNCFFKRFEERNLIAFGIIIGIFGSGITLMYVFNITLGMSPLIFVAFTTTVTDVLYWAFI